MKWAFVAALLIGSLTLSACAGAKASPSQNPEPQPNPPVTAPAPEPTPPKPPEPPAPPVPVVQQPAEPAIHWYAPDIGFPLVSDDPAAKGKKVVLLTFDDGPTDKGYTASILDTLKQENIKAIFFITGYGAKHMDLVERIHREGHVLGIHTMTHPNMRMLSKEKQREEIAPLYELIKQVTGEYPKYFRPPFGAYNPSLLELLRDEFKMELLNWSNGSLDWEGVDGNGYKDPQRVVADVMSQLHPGAVVLFHDTLRQTAEALPDLISKIRAEGYEFVVIK